MVHSDCERKQFKLAMTGPEQQLPEQGSVISLLATVLFTVMAVVILWRWVARPWLRKRFLTPKFLGHYNLYPMTGCWSRMKELENEVKKQKENQDKTPRNAVDDPYTGAPFDGGVTKEVATESEYAPLPAIPDNFPAEEGCHDVEPAMLPLTDDAGMPVVLQDTVCGADIWESLGTVDKRVIGVHRHDGVVTVYAPPTGSEWDRYGKSDDATEQTVAVFSMPAPKWWHVILA